MECCPCCGRCREGCPMVAPCRCVITVKMDSAGRVMPWCLTHQRVIPTPELPFFPGEQPETEEVPQPESPDGVQAEGNADG